MSRQPRPFRAYHNAKRVIQTTHEPVRANGLSLDEQLLLDGYRQLPNVPQLAVRCYILRRDIRLARAIHDRVFLNLPVRKLRD